MQSSESKPSAAAFQMCANAATSGLTDVFTAVEPGAGGTGILCLETVIRLFNAKTGFRKGPLGLSRYSCHWGTGLPEDFKDSFLAHSQAFDRQVSNHSSSE